jgi:tryptophan synthase alpha chain
MGLLEEGLRAVVAGGRKAFVPYVTGGFPGVDAELLRDLQRLGADAIEVGIPHSDPVMDGGVIQEASRVALERGTRVADVLEIVRDAEPEVPVAVMTYANPLHRRGPEAFCDDLVAVGVSGVIVPDLPVDEAGALGPPATARGIDLVLLAAPGTSDDRYAAIAGGSHGFVYCVATYGVTGARNELASTARRVVDALRSHTDLPLLVGVGIGTPDQARAACAFADGAIVGSALMARLVEGDRAGALALAGAFRAAID